MAPRPRYPAMLDLAGQPCLVVGGGAVAARKVSGLLDAGARVVVVAPDVHAALAARAVAAELTWEPRRIAEHEVDDLVAGTPEPTEPTGTTPWRLVVAATDQPALNRALTEAATRAGIWANDATDPAGGPLAVPAVHRHGPVTVAVATGGLSPGAAAWLRDQLADAIDPAVVEALDLLAEVLAELPGTVADAVTGHTGRSDGRLDWRSLVDSGMLDDIRHGHRARAKERLQACLS